MASLIDATMFGRTGTASNNTAPAEPANQASTNPDLGGVNVTPNPDREKAINDMYEANINAQKIKLQEAGDQALSDAQANRDKIAGIYDRQRNAAAVDWERQRRNFLEGAATSGLNTGAGSQAELHMMGSQQKTQNTLNAAQAQAETEADRNISDIARTTQAAINEAVQENDYKKAAALLDEYNAEYSRQMERASALSQYGDFSGYAAIYGAETAKQMFYSWAAQNPQLAYAMGAITADQYQNLASARPINDGLDANGVRITNVYNYGGGGGGGGSSRSEDPWAYGGSGWNYGGGGGGSDSGGSTADALADAMRATLTAEARYWGNYGN